MPAKMNNETATNVLNSAGEPCPAIGANRIGLLTNDARARLETRFWAKTEESLETGCIETTYAPTPSGYGMCGIAGTVTAETHRVAYVLTHGPIPSGLWVLHSCHNPRCVNPDHLRLGTHAENMQDMVEAGRARRGPGSNPRKLTAEMAMMILGDRLLGVPVNKTVSALGVSRNTVWQVFARHAHAAAITAHIDAELAAEAAERGRKQSAR